MRRWSDSEPRWVCIKWEDRGRECVISFVYFTVGNDGKGRNANGFSFIIFITIVTMLFDFVSMSRRVGVLKIAGAARHAHHINLYLADQHLSHGHAHVLSSNHSDKELSDRRSGSMPPGASSFMLLSMLRYRSTNLRVYTCDR